MCDFTKTTARLLLAYLEAQSAPLKLDILRALDASIQKETLRLDRATRLAHAETIELEQSHE